MLCGSDEKWGKLFAPSSGGIGLGNLYGCGPFGILCHGNLWGQHTTYSITLCSLTVGPRCLRSLPVGFLLRCSILELAQCSPGFLE